MESVMEKVISGMIGHLASAAHVVAAAAFAQIAAVAAAAAAADAASAADATRLPQVPPRALLELRQTSTLNDHQLVCFAKGFEVSDSTGLGASKAPVDAPLARLCSGRSEAGKSLA